MNDKTSRVVALAEARRAAINALNSAPEPPAAPPLLAAQLQKIQIQLVEVVANTEREIAEEVLESVGDIVAAANVLAEMVLAGPATDGRDETLAQNIITALRKEVPRCAS